MCLRELTKQSSELAHQRVLNAEGAANAEGAKAVVAVSQAEVKAEGGSVATSLAEGGAVPDPTPAPQLAAREAAEGAAEGRAEEAACESVGK